mmetsp:Transcript_9014/g.8105  ORF Transcript_9014/g.8105 Transcript_9014/m.8105 type:complete len:135 (-) Transcript_9014:103-507(-)|eukprot:CAMPEP_0201580538 /NCGR_PEP_ID=MMETSP0190_2-20130828/49574_1 /ASSEMBLY_ACC=CAM_ASM_000263 /TAXON_ID=37353 /ORGANISM="Rosalina sp." /LENGTH=134 /DNA_ID=CAMNT_0048016825 /DNA_START=75 /DNA_END=479 /DNA_ORIENTATION=-
MAEELKKKNPKAYAQMEAHKKARNAAVQPIDGPEHTKHKWEFEYDWDKETSEIVLRASDTQNDGEYTKNWEARLGKDKYKDPSTEYDRLDKIFSDDSYEIVFDDPSQGAKVKLPITLKFMKGKNAKESFELYSK